MILKGKTEFDFAYDESALPLKHSNATVMQEDDDKSENSEVSSG